MDVNVRDYGAIGNDVHDDTLAFRQALMVVEKSGGGTCFVPLGRYKVTGGGGIGLQRESIKSNMHLLGEERPNGSKSTIRIHTQLSTNYLLICHGDNWSIKTIKFDTVPTRNPALNAFATILARHGSKWLIQNCDFPNTMLRSLRINGGSYWTVHDNTFDSTYANGTGAHPVHEGMLITNATVDGQVVKPTHGTVSNNHLNGLGMNTLGNNMLYRGNHIQKPGVGAAIYISADQNNFNNILAGNICTLADEGIDDYQGGAYFQKTGIEIWSRDSVLVRNHCNSNAGSGINVGGQNSLVLFNGAENNGRDPFDDPRHHHAPGIVARAHADGNPTAQGSLFLGNTSIDTRPQAQKTQTYGFVTQHDFMRCISIIGSNFFGNELGPGFYRNVQPSVVVEKGGDMYNHLITPKMKDRMLDLFEDNSLFPGWSLADWEYKMLNQVLFGSSNTRP